MINNEFLKELSTRISALLPATDGVRADAEKSIQELLQSTFTRLNLVTREEFDAQTKVLARAEETIAVLEARLSSLESAEGITPPAPPENENP